MEIAYFERMSLNGSISSPLTDLRVDYWEREKGVAYWCMPYHILTFSLHFLSSLFFFAFHFLSHSHIPSIFPCFLLFSLLLFFSLVPLYCLPFSPFVVHSQALFYTACYDMFYCFTPQLLLAWYECPSRATHWSVGCSASTTTLCWLVMAAPCSIPKQKSLIFVFLLSMAFPFG